MVLSYILIYNIAFCFSIISDELQEQLRKMIEEPIKEDEPKPFQLTKKLYKACMNKTEIEADGEIICLILNHTI